MFASLAESAKGLFPADLLNVARSMGIEVQLPAVNAVTENVRPHPSPATSEWFFTAASARRLAASLPGRTLCLGTPSVAAAKAELGEPATLVDLSPWVKERYSLESPLLDLRIGRPLESLSLTPGYDSAILDPPWYFPSLTHWLELASSLVKQGGLVILPLLGELTRPAARLDRSRLIDEASAIGPWKLGREEVLYDTPRFERKALERSGIFLDRPWRKSDLLQVTNDRPALIPKMSESEAPEWHTFRCKDSLVSTRKASYENVDASDAFSRLDELKLVKTFAFDSVSKRNNEILEANVWTSESTGAVCTDTNSLRLLLTSDYHSLGADHRYLFDNIVRELELP